MHIKLTNIKPKDKNSFDELLTEVGLLILKYCDQADIDHDSCLVNTVLDQPEAEGIIKEVKNMCWKEISTVVSMSGCHKLDAKVVSKKMTELHNLIMPKAEAVQNGDRIKEMISYYQMKIKEIDTKYIRMGKKHHSFDITKKEIYEDFIADLSRFEA